MIFIFYFFLIIYGNFLIMWNKNKFKWPDTCHWSSSCFPIGVSKCQEGLDIVLQSIWKWKNIYFSLDFFIFFLTCLYTGSRFAAFWVKCGFLVRVSDDWFSSSYIFYCVKVAGLMMIQYVQHHFSGSFLLLLALPRITAMSVSNFNYLFIEIINVNCLLFLQ